MRVLLVKLTCLGMAKKERTLFTKRWVIPSLTEQIQRKRIKVHLSDSLVYKMYDGEQTDYHAHSLKITANLLDMKQWIASEDKSFNVLLSRTASINLTPPFSRPRKPQCLTWGREIAMNIQDRSIPTCPFANDVVELLTYPVALSGQEMGFVKFLDPIQWNDKEVEEYYNSLGTRFTVSMWIFIRELCPFSMCAIIQHRKGNFLTPMVALLPMGNLHIQVHYKDESGYAFLTSGSLPLNTWVNLMLSVDAGTQVEVFYRYGSNFKRMDHFLHSDYEPGAIYNDDAEGFWSIGGYDNFPSFKGLVAEVTMYRKYLLYPEDIPLPPPDHPMFQLGLKDYYRDCFNLLVPVRIGFEKRVQQLNQSTCAVRTWSMDDWGSVSSKAPQCSSGMTSNPGLDAFILSKITNSSTPFTNVTGEVLNAGMKMLIEDISNIPLALKYFQLAACNGHGKASYVMAVLNFVGLGMKKDSKQAWKYLLLSAVDGYALAQMSLGSKHLTGVDGFLLDQLTALGYYKPAAVSADKAINEHKEVDTHTEAIRLDHNEALEQHQGRQSDWFPWLTHQAFQGVIDAQNALADVFFFGQKGMERDLEKAVKFYEMGAKEGDPLSLFNLGVVKMKGHGTKKNLDEAYTLLSRSAEKDFVPAVNALGFYELNFRENRTGAVFYFNKSAHLEDRDGMFNLGVAYDAGWFPGIAPNRSTALDWWVKAAGKGHGGACISVAQALIIGDVIPRHTVNAAIYLRYISDQHSQLGMLLRNGLLAFFKGDWYSSFVHFLLAAETGMEVPGYNVGLLCENDDGDVSKIVDVDCVRRYFNYSSLMGWVPSTIKLGDLYWYGTSMNKNQTAAGELYGRAASKANSPHAVYNLAYLVEYNHSLDGIHWTIAQKDDILQGNLTFAALLYRNCRDNEENNNEALIPCTVGLVRVIAKDLWIRHNLLITVIIATLIVFLSGCSVLSRYSGQQTSLSL